MHECRSIYILITIQCNCFQGSNIIIKCYAAFTCRYLIITHYDTTMSTKIISDAIFSLYSTKNLVYHTILKTFSEKFEKQFLKMLK